MVTKKAKGLGLGLEALLGPKVADAPVSGDSAPATLRLELLQPGRYQPRTRMDEGSLYELAESIKSQGVMQPILVRPVAAGRYEIIAGERRFRAAGLAGLSEVPVLVRQVADEAAAVMALIENIQREDLNPLEEAQGLQRLTKEFGLTHEDAAKAVGRSRSAASNLLRGGQRQQRARVAHFQVAGHQHLLHRRRQLQQADQVAGRAARAAHRLRGLFVGELELVDQALQALRFFQRVEVFALDAP